MSARSVYYICRKHGEFVAHVKCGFGSGPAPKQMECTVPECFRLGDRKREAMARQRRDGTRSVAVPTPVYDRLKQYCEAQGISMAAWIDANTQDLEGGS